MGRSKNVIEECRTEEVKVEICLAKLRWSDELRCGNEIRSGVAFSDY